MGKKIVDIKDVPKYAGTVMSLETPLTFFMQRREERTDQWIAYVRNRAKAKNISVDKIAKLTNNTTKTVKKWFERIPAKRDSVISLGFALGCNFDEIQVLLELGLFSKLYVKNPDDAIWIYLLQSSGRDNIDNVERTHESYRRFFIILLYLNTDVPTRMDNLYAIRSAILSCC